MTAGRHRRRGTGQIRATGLVLVGAVAAAFAIHVPGAFGAYTAKVANSGASAASNPYFNCTAAVSNATAGRAYFAYPMADTGQLGTLPAADVSGNGRAGTYTTVGVTYNNLSPTVCPRDTPARSITLDGSSGYVSGPATPGSAPNVLTEEIWFKTTVAGGMLIGFGDKRTLLSNVHDRHLYVDSTGKLVFGVYQAAVKTISSAATVTDGAWHQALATLSPAGMALYLDGKLVAGNAAVTTAESSTGYWRIGYDNLVGWTNAPADYHFAGSLAWASVYTYALSATQVAQHYAAGR